MLTGVVEPGAIAPGGGSASRAGDVTAICGRTRVRALLVGPGWRERVRARAAVAGGGLAKARRRSQRRRAVGGQRVASAGLVGRCR